MDRTLSTVRLRGVVAVCLAAAVAQVIDYYRSRVVKLEAEKHQEEVSKQIREALAKIKTHADD